MYRQIDRKQNEIGHVLTKLFVSFHILNNVSKFVYVVARHPVDRCPCLCRRASAANFRGALDFHMT